MSIDKSLNLNEAISSFNMFVELKIPESTWVMLEHDANKAIVQLKLHEEFEPGIGNGKS